MEPDTTPTRDQRPLTWWLVATTLLTVVTGMGYSLWWPALVQHTSSHWIVPGDIWLTVRSAQWVDHGLLSYVYNSLFRPVTLPGMQVVLAPITAIGSALGLSESVPHYALARPTDWLLVGPVAMACAAVALFGFDSLARALALPVARRRILALVEAAFLWPTVVIWGHPEDVIAMGLCALCLSRLIRGRPVSAAWLLGAALAMQLYTLAAVPIFIGILGARRGLPFLVRAAVIPGALLLAVAVPDPHATFHVLLDQPNYPLTDHPTPWILLAPKLAQHVVAAGPGRIIGLALACGLGAAAWRWRRCPARAAWLLGMALGLRCVFESVMDPYYVAPAIGFFVLGLASRRWLRSAVGIAAAGALLELVYSRPGIWWYWAEMTAVMGALCLLAWPFEAAGPPTGWLLPRRDLLDVTTNVAQSPALQPVAVRAGITHLMGERGS